MQMGFILSTHDPDHKSNMSGILDTFWRASWEKGAGSSQSASSDIVLGSWRWQLRCMCGGRWCDGCYKLTGAAKL